MIGMNDSIKKWKIATNIWEYSKVSFLFIVLHWHSILAQAEATQNFAKAGSPTGSAGSFQEGYGGGYSGGQSFGGSFSGGYPGGAGFQFIPGVGANFGSGADGASAFGSIGPDGIQQKASIFPENPVSYDCIFF